MGKQEESVTVGIEKVYSNGEKHFESLEFKTRREAYKFIDEKIENIKFDSLKDAYYYIVSDSMETLLESAERKLSHDDYIWVMALLIRDLSEEISDA